jgi:hypothetical protein
MNAAEKHTKCRRKKLPRQAACLQNANTTAEAPLKHDKASAEKRRLFTPATPVDAYFVSCVAATDENHHQQ